MASPIFLVAIAHQKDSVLMLLHSFEASFALLPHFNAFVIRHLSTPPNLGEIKLRNGAMIVWGFLSGTHRIFREKSTEVLFNEEPSVLGGSTGPE